MRIWGRRHHRAPRPNKARCSHEWKVTDQERRIVAGRVAIETAGVCTKCGEAGTISTTWADYEPTPQEWVDLPRLTRREFETLMMALPAGRAWFYSPVVRFDVENLLDKFRAAGEGADRPTAA